MVCLFDSPCYIYYHRRRTCLPGRLMLTRFTGDQAQQHHPERALPQGLAAPRQSPLRAAWSQVPPSSEPSCKGRCSCSSTDRSTAARGAVSDDQVQSTSTCWERVYFDGVEGTTPCTTQLQGQPEDDVLNEEFLAAAVQVALSC